MKLREYQTDCVDRLRSALRRHRRAILEAPTGSGKTVMIAWMVSRMVAKGHTAWLVAHRKELLDQLSATLEAFKVPHGFIAAGRHHNPAAPVHVVSVQSAVRRLGHLKPPSVIALDECHHAVANTWGKLLEWAAGPAQASLTDKPPKSPWIIGLTATPERADGRGLCDVFETIVRGPRMKDLIGDGYLAPYRIVAPKTMVEVGRDLIGSSGEYVRSRLADMLSGSAIYGDAVKAWRQHAPGKNCLLFCVNRDHARQAALEYRSAGHEARYVGGDTSRADRERHIEDFRLGRFPILASVDLFAEGFDVPGLQSIQMLRPTRSLTVYRQAVGRVLRKEMFKDEATIIDMVGNVFRHGLPDEEIEWSLKGRKRRSSPETDSLVRCKKCFLVISGFKCQFCGHEHAQKRKLETVADEIVELTPEERKRERWAKRSEVFRAVTMEELVAIAKKRGYKVGWAARQYQYKQNRYQRTPLDLERFRKLENEVRRGW